MKDSYLLIISGYTLNRLIQSLNNRICRLVAQVGDMHSNHSSVGIIVFIDTACDGLTCLRIC